MEWNSVVWVCFFGCWVLLCSTWKAVLFVWWVTFNRSFKYFLLLHLIAFWKASIYYRTRLLFIVLMHFFQKKLRWLSVTEINWNQWNCFYFESNYFWIRNLSLRQDPNKPRSSALSSSFSWKMARGSPFDWGSLEIALQRSSKSCLTRGVQ